MRVIDITAQLRTGEDIALARQLLLWVADRFGWAPGLAHVAEAVTRRAVELGLESEE